MHPGRARTQLAVTTAAGTAPTADLYVDVAGEQHREEQRSAPKRDGPDAVVLVGAGGAIDDDVGEDVAVDWRSQVFDGGEYGVSDGVGVLPDLCREWRDPVPLKQLEQGPVDQGVVHQHAVEQLRQMPTDRSLAHPGVAQQVHHAGF